MALTIETKICKGNCSVCKGHGGQCTHKRPLSDYLMEYVYKMKMLWFKAIGMKYTWDNGVFTGWKNAKKIYFRYK